jgi:VWFA-related protein
VFAVEQLQKTLTNNPGLSPRSALPAIIAVALLFTSGSVYAQTPAPESTAQTSDVQSSSIRKTIRLVEVEVIAKDKKGRPVTGLEAKDFSLTDNGRVEKITLFSVQLRDDPAAANTGKDPGKPPSSPNPARWFSNRHSSSSIPVVILMDLLNTRWDNQPAIRASLSASLKRIPPETPIALLILGEDLRLISDFTTDASALAPLLKQPSASRHEGVGPAITAPKTSNEIINDVILKTAVRTFNQETGDRLDRTVRALNLIRKQLTRMSGRKSLIWIGGGLSVSPHDWPTVRNLIDQFNDANVAVYTVDARGVILDYGISADIDESDMLGPWAEEQADSRGDILDVIARSTGGVPYRNTNALDRAVTRAVDDNNTVYTLGYYPQHNDWQGKLHKIEVKVARAGLTLRYRSGYIAAPQAKPEPDDPPQTIEALAASPLDFPGIRFSVEAKPENDPAAQSFTLHIPLSELRLSSQDEKFVGALQLWFIQRQASGEPLTHKTSNFSFHLTTSQYEDALVHGLSLTSVLKLNKSTAKVRVLLRDINSGRVGTVDVPVPSTTNPTPQP